MVIADKTKYAVVLFFLLSLFIYTRSLGTHGLEYRDDEIFYFKATGEMLKTGNLFSPTYFGENRFQKPILFYWLVILSYKCFGLNWVSARLVAVFFASSTVSLTWLMAQKLFNERMAHLSTLILMTIPLFFRHAKDVVPDMVFNFFIVLAFYFFLIFLKEPHRLRDINLFFTACALGFLTKGFAAVVIPVGAAITFVLITRQRDTLSLKKILPGILLFIFMTLPWFWYMTNIHGREYLDYMLTTETKGRLLGTRHFSFGEIGGTRISNLIFYLRVLIIYFAPWGFLFLGAVPFLFKQLKIRSENRDDIILLLTWFFFGMIFFMLMSFVINHYLLVLSTPLAILVAYVCQQSFSDKVMVERILYFLRKFIFIFSFILGGAAYIFLVIFLLHYRKEWLLGFLPLFVLGIIYLLREKNFTRQTMVLVVFMLFLYMRSDLLNKAGLTPYTTLQRMAEPLQYIPRGDIAVGVGSHDIHEKEWQIYVNQKIYEAGRSSEDETRWHLSQLLNTAKPVYCLMTSEDYHRYADLFPASRSSVVREDHLMRRRMKIDGQFFAALLRIDQKKVYEYLMEKIVLVRREAA